MKYINLVTLIFITAKLIDLITWSWLLVLSPTIIYIWLWVLLLAAYGFLVAVKTFIDLDDLKSKK